MLHESIYRNILQIKPTSWAELSQCAEELRLCTRADKDWYAMRNESYRQISQEGRMTEDLLAKAIRNKEILKLLSICERSYDNICLGAKVAATDGYRFSGLDTQSLNHLASAGSTVLTLFDFLQRIHMSNRQAEIITQQKVPNKVTGIAEDPFHFQDGMESYILEVRRQKRPLPSVEAIIAVMKTYLARFNPLPETAYESLRLTMMVTSSNSVSPFDLRGSGSGPQPG